VGRAVPAARYELRWETFPTKVRPGELKPGEDGAFTGTGLVILDHAGGRVRADQDDRYRILNRPERLHRIRQSVRYDGREQSALLTMDPAATAPAEPAAKRVFVGAWGDAMRWPAEFAPLMLGHGLVVPDGGPQTGPFPYAWRVTADRYQHAGREDVAGRACAVVRDTAASETVPTTLWVDLADGAVVRARTGWPGGTTQEVAVTYRDTPHGRLPAGWEAIATRKDRPAAVERKVTVTAIGFDPPTADDFRVPYRPGMIVDRGGRSWMAGAGGELSLIPPEPGTERPSLFGRAVALFGPVGLVGLVAATGLTGGLVVVRRRAAGRQAPGASAPRQHPT